MLLVLPAGARWASSCAEAGGDGEQPLHRDVNAENARPAISCRTGWRWQPRRQGSCSHGLAGGRPDVSSGSSSRPAYRRTMGDAATSLTSRVTDLSARAVGRRCRRRAWAGCARWIPMLGSGGSAHRTLQLDDQQRSFVALLPQKPAAGLGGACRWACARRRGCALAWRGAPRACALKRTQPCCSASKGTAVGVLLPIALCWLGRPAAHP